MLSVLRPRHVILYEPEVSCVRQIEMHQATECESGSPPVNVHFFVFDGSAEEQRYLRRLQVEKDSFERLIQEKSRMARSSDVSDHSDHPDLMRGEPADTLLHPDEAQSQRISSRRGGFNKNAPQSQKLVLVDMREFRSQLPSHVHKLAIDLVPITLDIGDYLLTPDTCVERKSVSDLIGSLNSGRLYSQAQAMTRYYRRPVLLIEFDEAKSFNFKARYWSPAMHAQQSGGQTSSSNK